MINLLTAIKNIMARRRIAKHKLMDARLCARFAVTFEQWMPTAASAFTKQEIDSAIMSYLLGTRRLWATTYMTDHQCDVWKANFNLFSSYYKEWVMNKPNALGGFHEWCMINRVKATLL